MERPCVKTEAWNIRQQIEANQVEFEDSVNFAAWFEWEYEWPALYADEGGQGESLCQADGGASRPTSVSSRSCS